MSIQNEFDLALVGNITVDDVYAIHGWPDAGTSNVYSSNRKSVGGLGNIIEALAGRLRIHVEAKVGDDEDGRYIAEYLTSRGVQFVLHLSEKPTTKAVIFSDVKNSERTSFVEWGCGRDGFKPKAVEAKWGHLSYADVLAEIDMSSLRGSCKTLSADVCLSIPTLTPLKYIDLLFVSKSENVPLLETQTVILHSRRCSQIREFGKEEVVVTGLHKIIEEIDVLGAGDAYCAGFIHSMLKESSLAGAALLAHDEATNFIVRRRDKNEKI